MEKNEQTLNFKIMETYKKVINPTFCNQCGEEDDLSIYELIIGDNKKNFTKIHLKFNKDCKTICHCWAPNCPKWV